MQSLFGVRQTDSKKAVEPNFKKHLVEKKSELEDYFDVDLVTYDIEKGGRQVPTVYCLDIVGFIR